MLVVPAVSVGANGRLAPGHDVPCGPDVTSYVEDAETVCVASSNASAVQGTNAAFVVYAPQRDGEASGARSPPKKCSSGSSATMYIPTRLPNGLASCEARYTAPSRSLGRNGVFSLTVPIFEAFGQKFTPGSSASL